MALVSNQTSPLNADGTWQKVALTGTVTIQCDLEFKYGFRADTVTEPDSFHTQPPKTRRKPNLLDRTVPDGGALWVKASYGASFSITAANAAT